MNLKIVISLCLILLISSCNNSQNNGARQSGVHFALKEKRLQKPVGLLFYKDKYHLFYKCSTQENKYEWGHAQSSDLLHWEQLPLAAIHSESYSIGNGSIVIDLNNTCGLGKGNSPLVRIYCSDINNQSLSLSYSADNGNTWNEYTEKAIKLNNLHTQINDIKVCWHEESQKWVMLVLSGHEVWFYTSDNLINWTFTSRFGEGIHEKSGDWTAIDFFPIEDEETKKMKWSLLISSDSGSPNESSGIQYFIGDFDGNIFNTPQFKPRWLDNGSDNYSGVVSSEYFGSVQQTYFIGSIYNSIYNKFKINEKESNAFTLARKLTLKNRFDGYIIYSEPVKALETIEKGKQLIKESKFSGELKFKEPKKLPLEINLKFDVNNRLSLGMAEVFGVKVTNEKGEQLLIGYHSERRYFFIADPTISQKYPNTWNGFDYAPYVILEPTMDFKIIIDCNSIELFALNGLISLTRKYFFSSDWAKIALYTEGGDITLTEGNIRELKGIW